MRHKRFGSEFRCGTKLTSCNANTNLIQFYFGVLEHPLLFVALFSDAGMSVPHASLPQALVWSFIFCFVIMTVWAMLMVEFIYPLILELSEDGTFGNCPQCTRATSSVMSANVLLFKTVIAGDSWGEIAVPVIEKFPWTAIVFMGSLLTLVFGVLNLIVAAFWTLSSTVFLVFLLCSGKNPWYTLNY